MVSLMRPQNRDGPSRPGHGDGSQVAEEIKKREARAHTEWQELRKLIAAGAATAEGDDRARYRAAVNRFIAALRDLRSLRREPQA
jgi:hypothetical protein